MTLTVFTPLNQIRNTINYFIQVFKRGFLRPQLQVSLKDKSSENVIMSLEVSSQVSFFYISPLKMYKCNLENII